MCYSAQIWADYRRYKRAYGSEIDIATFAELFWSRLSDPRSSSPKRWKHRSTNRSFQIDNPEQVSGRCASSTS